MAHAGCPLMVVFVQFISCLLGAKGGPSCPSNFISWPLRAAVFHVEQRPEAMLCRLMGQAIEHNERPIHE